MDKEKLKKGLNISLIIFAGLALAITYFFLLYSNKSIGDTLSQIAVILRPFIIGGVIAYIMKSTCNAYEKLLLKGFSKKKRSDEKKDAKKANIIAVVLTYITWITILGALLWVAIPQIIQSVSTFVQDIIRDMPIYIETATEWINNFKTQYPAVAPFVDKAGEFITTWLTTTLPEMLPDIGGSLVNGAVGIFNTIKDIAIGFVISVFFLSGRKTFARKSSLLIKTFFKEKHADAIISEAKFADRMFGGFLEGKIIDSTIIGIVYFLALVIMKVEYPALIALICGVTNVIPFFGPFIGAVPSGLIILMSHSGEPYKLLFFIIFVCIVQFIDGNIIEPHIVGGNIKLSPFCVIFAVLLFGGIWGFWGLLIGVPTFAVIYDIAKKYIYHRLKKTGKKHILRQHFEESGRLKKRPAEVRGAAGNTEEAADGNNCSSSPEGK